MFHLLFSTGLIQKVALMFMNMLGMGKTCTTSATVAEDITWRML